MRYISLFTGVAGLDRAIDSLGGECLVQVEKDPYCLSVLSLRYPDVPKVTDVHAYRGEHGADLVIGGPPCQPVSHAGRRKGADDERWLWGQALRVVGESRPERVFFENPMGLRTLGLETVLEGLTELGYGGAWEVVAAADVGAPHLRKRLFILGVRGRPGGFAGPTRPPGNGRTVFPSPTTADGSGGPGTTPKREGGMNLRTYVNLWPTPTSRDWKDTGDSIGNGTVPVNGLLGRAVAPSKAHGALNPTWEEWLMALPEGWTDVTRAEPGPVHSWDSEPNIPRIGLNIPNRPARVKAIGNAVCPPQAVFAWRRLTERLDNIWPLSAPDNAPLDALGRTPDEAAGLV